MIQTTRVRFLNDDPVADRSRYVLYWMQASQRTRFNHALEYAIERANKLRQPLLVGFGLTDNYPEANARHYAFMLEGLRDVEANLAARRIGFVLRRGQPDEVALALAKRASIVVCDRGYQRLQKRWRDRVADEAGRQVVQVESDVVVPVEEASDKPEFAARTLRPRIHRIWSHYLVRLAPRRVALDGRKLKFKSDLDFSDPLRAIDRLRVDRAVKPSSRFTGGENAAGARLRKFVSYGLDSYADRRNDPADQGTSMLSAYLHFGQISPLPIALAVRGARAAGDRDRESLLEELVVRRELAVNYVHFTPNYDAYDALPAWARKTLAAHQRDKRPAIYSRAQLENAQTADRYWNAAQREMTRTGYMHNYMRMYLGKRILEWKGTPREAFDETLYLNNKYFLCGRDPNAFANVAWIFGLHDRPWGERKIFGTVRYMNAAGLERKFDMGAYVKWVDTLPA